MAQSPIPIGRLRHRLMLETPVDMPDGAGGVSRSWTDAGAVWAAVEPVAAEPHSATERFGQPVTHRITFRRRPGLSTRHRFRRGTRTFELRSFHETGDGGFLVALAEEILP